MAIRFVEKTPEDLKAEAALKTPAAAPETSPESAAPAKSIKPTKPKRKPGSPDDGAAKGE